MVNDGECPFMFDGSLSFDRVLMLASQASTAWSGPLPPLRGPPPPASGGRQGFGLIAPLLHVFLAHPHLGGGWRAERDGRGHLGVGFQLLYPLIYNPFDFHTDFFEVEVDLTIIEADDLDVIAFEKNCPLPVVSFFFFGVMLAAVQFYNQADLRTVEIADIVAYDFLPVEAEAVFSKEEVPQFSFFLCHVSSKFFRPFQ